jgi:hypothetical protein
MFNSSSRWECDRRFRHINKKKHIVENKSKFPFVFLINDKAKNIGRTKAI